MAFALDLSPEEAKKSFASSFKDMIVQDGKVWIPVEVTERDGTFLPAWQTGAKEWRESFAQKQAAFYPVREAWKVYEPANFTAPGSLAAVPAATEVLKAYQSDLDTLIDREIYSQVLALQNEVTKSKNDPKAVNSLGLLYARYDKRADAEREFLKATAKAEYVPALVNLGNVYYLDDKVEKALAIYERAYKKEPKNPKVLVSLARASWELENYYLTSKAYKELEAVDPGLAGRYAYLKLRTDEAGLRAAGVEQLKEEMTWAD
jgi:tetratricopeptide (TPR) repeat protein